MTCLKIDLHVLNVDLADETTIERIGSQLADLVWSSVDGRVIASLVLSAERVSSCAERIDAVVQTARRIDSALPDAFVESVSDDLVSVSDIAGRLDLNRETVRSYVTAVRGPGGFPSPIATLGGGERGGTKVWRWSEVSSWLRRHHFADEYLYPSRVEAALMNAALIGSKHHAEWLSASPLRQSGGAAKVLDLDTYRSQSTRPPARLVSSSP